MIYRKNIIIYVRNKVKKWVKDKLLSRKIKFFKGEKNKEEINNLDDNDDEDGLENDMENDALAYLITCVWLVLFEWEITEN